ncbi:TetR/AcrR family transcriptional regulator [Pukyongiella litopenaei]|uniref:TetR/AcrR family transcriptional regulator n=1 Tax=Pukyongiella litopenaei TaxID=2605946 RepID=A0A2S0MN34_9RHOB|nr:TetR/AcrR family transcriptional regulator [Pukyongiella litopenaei]AVO37151.1 TetR/AcrR family transcriptional regulator [Pukyongiella litopenaei]
MSNPTTRATRPVKQARTIRSERRLLDAAEALFADQGYQATRVTDIIDRAGCSTGTFYNRFGDKDGLARVMIHEFVRDSRAEIDALDLGRAVHGDLRAMLRFLAETSHDMMNRRLGVYRASQRLTTLGADRSVYTGMLVAQLEERVTAHLDDYRDEIAAPDKAAALGYAVQLIIMVMLQTRLGAGPLFPKGKDELADLTVQAAMGLLTQEKPDE